MPVSGENNTILVRTSVSGDKAAVKDVDLSHPETVIGDHMEEVGTVTIDFSGFNSIASLSPPSKFHPMWSSRPQTP